MALAITTREISEKKKLSKESGVSHVRKLLQVFIVSFETWILFVNPSLLHERAKGSYYK